MKYYLGRLAINEYPSGIVHLSDALFVARDEVHAKDLLESRASLWGGDDGEQDLGGYRFSSEDSGTFYVRAQEVFEISPSTFDDLKDRCFVVFGERETAEAEKQEPAEAVKTLARRIGDQLAKQGAKVGHSKLLHAVAASLGATDWQVLAASAANHESAQRYLWLRDQAQGYDQFGSYSPYVVQGQTMEPLEGAKLDQLVDAARLKGKPSSAGGNAGTKGKPWYPTGNWPTGPLRPVKELDFTARVNAIWLTHGDVVLAAKLLHVAPEDLMGSFVHPMEADTAFCGRMVDWKPEHSLAPNLGMAEAEGHWFHTQTTLHERDQQVSVAGYVNHAHLVQFSTTSGQPRFTWPAALPSGLSEVSRLAACLNAVLRKAYNEMAFIAEGKEAPSQETQSDAIKAEYLESSCSRADLEHAIARLREECPDLFEDDDARCAFLFEAPQG